MPLPEEGSVHDRAVLGISRRVYGAKQAHLLCSVGVALRIWPVGVDFVSYIIIFATSLSEMCLRHGSHALRSSRGHVVTAAAAPVDALMQGLHCLQRNSSICCLFYAEVGPMSWIFNGLLGASAVICSEATSPTSGDWRI